jgi:DNA invertase Pin-like site-specific DNA recombinase
MNTHQKITAHHLKRDAYLYIRQSTLKQIMENQESTKRQYALKERAIQLGWPIERVIIIDSDLGQSGAQSVDRVGFQKLVSEVGMGRAGIVMGLEVSRLARNSSDWHRLLEICALSQTLILDEDGVYDPAHFNDRLLLGLKGTMSEAELHVLRARLLGGILNKARRGELKIPLPVGLVYDSIRKCAVLDPDKQVQESLRLFFETFRRTGSAMAAVKAFRKQELKFPTRIRTGAERGRLLWGQMTHSRALQILHNPRYSGAFVFGKRRTRMKVDGSFGTEKIKMEEWQTLIPNAHDGYISWHEYQQNLSRLKENASALGADRRKSPPREGPALIQGLVLCGVCGNRMTVRYHLRQGKQIPDYVCQKKGIQNGITLCQSINGRGIDEAIGRLLIDAVTPLTIEIAVSVQQELNSRSMESDQLRKRSVERARYEADLAQRRYMQVDPENRLVADALESDWNAKLRELTSVQEQYDKKKKADLLVIDDKKREEIMTLCTQFPVLWKNPKTPDRERKRMVRLIIEDVTLKKEGKREQIQVQIRFKGGASQTLTIDPPLLNWERNQTDSETMKEFDRLLESHTHREIADILNRRGLKPGMAKEFTAQLVNQLRCSHGLKTLHERLKEKGLLTLTQISKFLNICPRTANVWRNNGILKAYKVSDKPEYLYEPPGKEVPNKQQGVKLLKRAVLTSQYEGGAV